jgi:uncharacterized membrane protein YhaH (DUF805 family)
MMQTLFSGRIARLNYFIAAIVLSFLIGLLSVLTFFGGSVVATIGSVLVSAAGIVFSLSLSVRRAHDMGWSGWAALLMFVPLVNFIFALIFLFKKGTMGPNQYGAEPSTAVDVFGTLYPKGQSAPMM